MNPKLIDSSSTVCLLFEEYRLLMDGFILEDTSEGERVLQLWACFTLGIILD